MNDRVDDIHSDIEYPIEHYEQDQESMHMNQIDYWSKHQSRMNLPREMHEWDRF